MILPCFYIGNEMNLCGEPAFTLADVSRLPIYFRLHTVRWAFEKVESIMAIVRFA